MSQGRYWYKHYTSLAANHLGMRKEFIKYSLHCIVIDKVVNRDRLLFMKCEWFFFEIFRRGPFCTNASYWKEYNGMVCTNISIGSYDLLARWYRHFGTIISSVFHIYIQFLSRLCRRVQEYYVLSCLWLLIVLCLVIDKLMNENSHPWTNYVVCLWA